MICIECMKDKNSDEYSIVHHSIKEDELEEFVKNPSKFKAIYCICDACVNSNNIYPTLKSIQ